MTKIAIIGGSGLENPAIMKNASDLKVETPYLRVYSIPKSVINSSIYLAGDQLKRNYPN